MVSPRIANQILISSFSGSVAVIITDIVNKHANDAIRRELDSQRELTRLHQDLNEQKTQRELKQLREEINTQSETLKAILDTIEKSKK